MLRPAYIFTCTGEFQRAHKELPHAEQDLVDALLLRLRPILEKYRALCAMWAFVRGDHTLHAVTPSREAAQVTFQVD